MEKSNNPKTPISTPKLDPNSIKFGDNTSPPNFEAIAKERDRAHSPKDQPATRD